MSELENNLKAKIAGLKEQQFRRQYDITMGVDGEAFEMKTPREPNMELSGRNRGRRVAPGYEYSMDELQAAMDASNTENMIGYSIFDNVLRRTGNPRTATQAMNVASMTPFVGTAMGLEDSYDAARSMPDAYAMGGVPGVLSSFGTIGIGVGDAALSMAPFAAPVVKGTARGAANVARPLFEKLSNIISKPDNAPQTSMDFGFDDYLNLVNPGQKMIDENVRPNLRMGDMYGMLPRNAELVGANDQVKFFRGPDGSYYATAFNPDLNEEDVVGFIKNYGNETELAVVSEMQNKGIGGELQYLFRRENLDAPSGGLTEAGARSLERTYDRLFDEGSFEGFQGAGQPAAQATRPVFAELEKYFRREGKMQ